VNKLILAIPTYGRTWVINKDTSRTGIPPLKVEGPGEKGPLVQEEGLLSYGEICSQLASLTDANASPTTLRRVPDTQKRMGTYAFRLPNKQLKQEYGIWVSYEDPDTVGVKAAYAKQNGLAGVAMVDLSLDDFKGNCGEKYVLVKSAKHHLK
jgi:Chitinase